MNIPENRSPNFSLDVQDKSWTPTKGASHAPKLDKVRGTHPTIHLHKMEATLR
jgi:hypothetical protein